MVAALDAELTRGRGATTIDRVFHRWFSQHDQRRQRRGARSKGVVPGSSGRHCLYATESSSRCWCCATASASTNQSESGLDRKSTRLNSSHEWSSYAVFCLKKK